MPKASGLAPPRAGLGDGGGELGHQDQARRDILSLSLLSQAPCPTLPPLPLSTLSDGNNFTQPLSQPFIKAQSTVFKTSSLDTKERQLLSWFGSK